MDELQQLLQRWAELEPGRCYQFADDHFFVTIQKKEEAVYGDNWASLATVEYAIREAVIARGWHCRITLHSLTNECRVHAGREVYEQTGTEPAIALLQAYIEALEGQK